MPELDPQSQVAAALFGAYLLITFVALAIARLTRPNQ